MPIETGASSYFWGDLGSGASPAPGYYVDRIEDRFNRSCPGCCFPEFCIDWEYHPYGLTAPTIMYMQKEDHTGMNRLRLPATLPGYYWTGQDDISKYAFGVYWDGGRWSFWEIDLWGTSPDVKITDMGTDPEDPSYDDGDTIITMNWECDAGGTPPTGSPPSAPPTP